MSDSQAQQLHDKFRQIIMMLVLVKATKKSTPRLKVAEAAEEFSSRRGLPDAVTTILTMSHEILAATTYEGQLPQHDLTVDGGLYENSDSGANPMQDDVPSIDLIPGPGTMDETKATSEGLHVVCIANTDDNKAKSKIYQELENKQSSHPIAVSIRGVNWDDRQKNKPSPYLLHHAAKVEGYLVRYKACKDADPGKGCYEFFRYVLEACKTKIRKRFTSWGFLGIFYNLTEFWGKVEGMPTVETFTGAQVDKDLTCVLSCEYFTDDTLTRLKRIMGIDVSDHTSLLRHERKYDARTASGFHILLIGLFIQCGVALNGLENAANRGDGEWQAVFALFLLSRLTASTALVTHMSRLMAAGLRFPSASHQDAYFKFGLTADILTNNDPSIKRMLHEPCGDKKTGDEDGGKENGNEDGNEDGDEDRDEDEDAKDMLQAHGRSGKKMARWLGLLPSHFSAIHAFHHSVPKDLKITILYQKPNRRTLPGWVDLEALLNEIIPSEDVAITTFATLREKVTEFKSMKAKVQWSPSASIFRLFSRLQEQRIDGINERFTVHCEAALAAYSLQHSQVKKEDIAVSKLCCPVCWELMGVLRRDSSDFQVRGYHRTLTVLELPSQLPEDALHEMIRRYRLHLVQALEELNRPEPVGVERDGVDSDGGLSCVESDGGLTISSIDSGCTRDLEANRFEEEEDDKDLAPNLFDPFEEGEDPAALDGWKA